MPDIITPKKKQKVILDATTLTTMMACARLGDFKFNYHFQPAVGKSNSLECGSITHKVLEEYYRAIIKGSTRSKAIPIGMEAGLQYIKGCRHCTDFAPHQCHLCQGTGDYETCPNCNGTGRVESPSCKHQPNEYPGVHNTPADSITKPHKRIGYKWVLQTCEEYFEYTKNNHWVPLEVERVKGKILYEDDDIVVLWKAKLDLIADMNDGIFSVDHKSMSQNRSTNSMNNQFMGQALLMGTQSVFINKIGFQTSLKPVERFICKPVCYSVERLIEWQSETLPYYAYLMLAYAESGHYPPNLTHCHNQYGQCHMVRVCESDPEMREEVLKRDFIIGAKWDVLNVDVGGNDYDEEKD